MVQPISHSVYMDPKPVTSVFRFLATHDHNHRSLAVIRVVFTIRNNDIVSGMNCHPTSPNETHVTISKTCHIRFRDIIGSTRGALTRPLEVLLSDLDALE